MNPFHAYRAPVAPSRPLGGFGDMGAISIPLGNLGSINIPLGAVEVALGALGTAISRTQQEHLTAQRAAGLDPSGRGRAAGAEPSALDQYAAWRQTPLGKVYTYSMWVAAPVAAALSYRKNKSIGWAALHGLVLPRFYLAYRGVDALAGGSSTRSNGRRKRRRNGRRR